MEGYHIYLEYNGVVVDLPVLPQQLTTHREHDNYLSNTLGVGEIVLPRIPKLKVVELDSYFPAEKNPAAYGPFFTKAMEDRAVVIYTKVPDPGNELPCQMVVTRFDTWEKGGEPGDLYFHLELTEYRAYAGAAMQVTPASSGPTTSTRENPPGILTVGTRCTASGQYAYTSYGDGPFGSASGKTVVISRMVDASRPRPIHITTQSGGPLGWVAESQLEVLG